MLGRTHYGIEIAFARMVAAQEAGEGVTAVERRLEYIYIESLEAHEFLVQVCFFDKLLGLLGEEVDTFRLRPDVAVLRAVLKKAYAGRNAFEHWVPNAKRGVPETRQTAEQFIQAPGIVQGTIVKFGTHEIDLLTLRDAIRDFAKEKVVPTLEFRPDITAGDGSERPPPIG